MMVKLEKVANRSHESGALWVNPDAVVTVEDSGLPDRAMIRLVTGQAFVVTGGVDAVAETLRLKDEGDAEKAPAKAKK